MSTKSPTNGNYRSYPAKQLAEYLRTAFEQADGEIYINGDRLTTDFDFPPQKIDRFLILPDVTT